MKTSGVLLPPASLIGRAPRNAVSNWKSVTTLMPVSLVNCGKSAAMAFDQGWITPTSVIVLSDYSINTLAAAPADVGVALDWEGQVYGGRRVRPVLAVVRSSADLGGRGASNAGCGKRVPGRAVLATAAGGKPRGRA